MAAVLDGVSDRLGVERESLSFGLRSGTRGTSGVVVALVYVERTPLAVCRIPRAQGDGLSSELEAWREVDERVAGDPYLERTVESPYFTADVEGRSVVVSEFLPGQPLSEYLPSASRQRAREFLRSATRWLVAFLEATADRWAYDPVTKRERLADLGGTPGTTPADAFVRDETQFVAPMHGDFETQNVLASGDGRVTGVIDWEDATLDGVPLYDLTSLLVDAAKRLTDGEETVERLFFRQGWLSAVANECVSYFCSRLGARKRSFLRALPVYVDVHRHVEYSGDWSQADSRFYGELQDALERRNDDIVWAC